MLLLPSFATAQAPARSVPSRVEVERELGNHYEDSVRRILKAMDAEGNYDALVKVSLDEDANWDGLADLDPAQADFLPGTLRKNLEENSIKRQRLEQALPQKREVLVIAPKTMTPEMEKNAQYWISRELNLAKTEAVKFQGQAVGEDKQFTRLYWIAVIVAGAFVAAVAILALLMLMGRRANPAPKPKDDQEPLPAPSRAPDAQAPTPNPAAAPTAALEPTETVQNSLAFIKRLSSVNAEVASLAFTNMIGRSDMIEVVANVVAALGMDTAVEIYPKVSGKAWSRLGDTLAQKTTIGEVSVEQCQQFIRALNGEIARMQQHANNTKLVPNLEAKGAGEIANRIRGSNVDRGATLMSLLSDVAIGEVAPKISTRELGPLLTKMIKIESIPLQDVTKFDRDETLVEVAGQVVSIEAVAKVAAALSSLSASEEFAMFDQLQRNSGGRLLGQIAPYRLYPAHIRSIPREIISQVIQSRDLAELRRLIVGLKGDAGTYVMQFVGQRQREALEEPGLETIDGSAAVRSFLTELHERLTQAYGSNDLQALFRNERAS